MAKTPARSADLEPIDRLEDKLKSLVEMVEKLKAEAKQATEDNTRLTAEVTTLRDQLAASHEANAELLHLKEERDLIKGRVSEMLQQLELLEL